jgi:single-strand DNA-binding protein
MAANVNRVVVVGNLTKDPEVKSTQSGTAICKLRLAVNSSRKTAEGRWEDKPNYFDVIVFGKQAENAGQYLAKGRPVAVDGRLDWSEWEKDGVKRQTVRIIADSLQYLGGKGDTVAGSAAAAITVYDGFEAPAPADSDIPF